MTDLLIEPEAPVVEVVAPEPEPVVTPAREDHTPILQADIADIDAAVIAPARDIIVDSRNAEANLATRSNIIPMGEAGSVAADVYGPPIVVAGTPGPENPIDTRSPEGNFGTRDNIVADGPGTIGDFLG